MRTVNINGPLDLDNPFFKALGTNGRSCLSCHRPAQGWTITPESVQERFKESRGLDPITGQWADIGKFKGPVLRALAARAPYFHNGSASSLDAVLDFYETRFKLGLTPGERADVLAFLRAL